MSPRSFDSFDREVTPEEVQSIIEEVGREGWIQIKFFDTKTPVLHPVIQIGQVDDGGLELTTTGQETFLQWDEIEWVKPFKGNPHDIYMQ